jgi:hypothetical protein
MDPALNNRSNQLSELVGMTSTIDSTSTLLQRQVKKMPGISFPRSQQTADAVLSTSKYLAHNCLTNHSHSLKALFEFELGYGYGKKSCREITLEVL